ncbi:MAG: peptidoglycan-binding domain-containing protein [Calothrix sp. MO_167.B42]|nr:peptidoglycan-binding domain-containing protein [Calothrix sp. MO_167.B42]
MKSSFSAKLLSDIPSPIIWQICLIISSITPMIFVVSPATSQTIAQVVVGRNISRPNLKVGSQGESVSELQAALKLLGFYTGKVDGKYGNSTASAVSKFKQAAGLKPDGIVDTNTWQKLFPGQQVQVSTQQTSTQQTSTQQTSTRQISTRQTSRQGNSSQVSVSSQTIQTTTNLPEPRPAQPKPTTANNTKPEPRPAKPKPTTARARRKPTQTTRKQTSSTTTRQASRSSRSPSRRRASRTRAIQRRRTQQSQKLFGTSRKPYLQYTAQGLPILRQGAQGSEVVTLQNRLKKRGFLKGNVDGDFGKQTLAAVQAFQRRYGLEDDGVVGGATWRILLRR